MILKDILALITIDTIVWIKDKEDSTCFIGECGHCNENEMAKNRFNSKVVCISGAQRTETLIIIIE